MHDVACGAPVVGARTVIELKDVGYTYPGGENALSDICLSIYEYDKIALVGHNGSGKTTLAKIIAGIYAPTEGECFRGEPHPISVGIVFQDPDDQLFCTTVYDDMAFGLLTIGHNINDIPEYIFQMAAKLGIDDNLIYKEPHNLSYGQRKLAALASAVVMNPEVLVIDEPTAGLDPEHEEKLLEVLDEYSGTLICISHDLFFLYHICHRAIVLKQGMVHHDYTMNDLVSHKTSLKEHGLDFTFRFQCCSADFSQVFASCTKPRHESSYSDDLIFLEDIGYRYPDGTPGIENVSLRIAKGERVALIGANGSGKSTLAFVIGGVVKPWGIYRFSGSPVTDDRRRHLWQSVGIVFQDPMDQLFCTSCREEVAFGPENMKLTYTEVNERVVWALNAVLLSSHENRVPHRLSGGEQKRVALASVLSMKPEVLILDEPTNNLDPEGEARLIEILDALDITLIIISHDLCFLSFLCDRAVIMNHGRIVGDMPFSELLRRERAMDGLHLNHSHHHGYRHRCCRAIREIFYQ